MILLSLLFGKAVRTEGDKPRAGKGVRSQAPQGSRQSQPGPTWLPEDRQVGLPAGELRIGEHHDTVLGGFVETKHSLLVIFHWKNTKQKCLFRATQCTDGWAGS